MSPTKCHVLFADRLLSLQPQSLLITTQCSLDLPNSAPVLTVSVRFRSTQRLKQLVRQTRGRVIPGHDEETFLALQKEADEQKEKGVFT